MLRQISSSTERTVACSRQDRDFGFRVLSKRVQDVTELYSRGWTDAVHFLGAIEGDDVDTTSIVLDELDDCVLHLGGF